MAVALEAWSAKVNTKGREEKIGRAGKQAAPYKGTERLSQFSASSEHLRDLQEDTTYLQYLLSPLNILIVIGILLQQKRQNQE